MDHVKPTNCTLLPACLLHTILNGQVGINTTNPSSASVLDVSSSSDNINFGGFLPPRVSSTTDRNAINPTPSDIGLLIFIESTGCYQIWNGTYWEDIHCVTNAAHANNLFISEYVEGSGFNKIIEVANFTGSSIDLDDFKISVYVNGNISFITVICIYPWHYSK